jgi:hypothetical protein
MLINSKSSFKQISFMSKLPFLRAYISETIELNQKRLKNLLKNLRDITLFAETGANVNMAGSAYILKIS